MTLTSSSSPPLAFPASALGAPEPASTAAASALLGAQAGSEAAFAQLIRAHERAVYSLARRALGNAAEAEELAQDVFLQLYLDLRRIESADHLRYWLRRTASHRVIDRLRQRQRRPRPDPLTVAACDTSGLDLPGAADRDPLLCRCLERLVAELPATPRMVLILRFQEDLDPAEIAGVLDLPVNTVKSHLKRSLARLRAELADGDSP